MPERDSMIQLPCFSAMMEWGLMMTTVLASSYSVTLYCVKQLFFFSSCAFPWQTPFYFIFIYLLKVYANLFLFSVCGGCFAYVIIFTPNVCTARDVRRDRIPWNWSYRW